MPPKRAIFYTFGDDEKCMETRRFIENAGIILDVRDISRQPLTELEVSRIIGNLELSHFINQASEAYDKLNMDKFLNDRAKVFQMIASDNSLLRRPIIKSARLLIVGHDRRKIAEMLQFKPNGNGPNADEPVRNSREESAPTR